MKINSTITKLFMVTAFGLVLHSCSTDDNEIQSERAVKTEIEVSTEIQSKYKDTLPNDSEPVIVIPPRK